MAPKCPNCRTNRGKPLALDRLYRYSRKAGFKGKAWYCDKCKYIVFDKEEPKDPAPTLATELHRKAAEAEVRRLFNTLNEIAFNQRGQALKEVFKTPEKFFKPAMQKEAMVLLATIIHKEAERILTAVDTGSLHQKQLNIYSDDFSDDADFSQSSMTTTHLAFGKNLGNTLQRLDMYSVLAGNNKIAANNVDDVSRLQTDEDGAKDLGLRARFMRQFSIGEGKLIAVEKKGATDLGFSALNVRMVVEDGIIKNMIEGGSKLSKRFGLDGDPVFGDNLGRRLRKIGKEISSRYGCAVTRATFAYHYQGYNRVCNEPQDWAPYFPVERIRPIPNMRPFWFYVRSFFAPNSKLPCSSRLYQQISEAADGTWNCPEFGPIDIEQVGSLLAEILLGVLTSWIKTGKKELEDLLFSGPRFIDAAILMSLKRLLNVDTAELTRCLKVDGSLVPKVEEAQALESQNLVMTVNKAESHHITLPSPTPEMPQPKEELTVSTAP